MGHREEPIENLAAAGGGDADALQRLIVVFHDPVRGVVSAAIDNSLRHRIDPDDVLQEAYAAAFKALRSRSGREGSGTGEQGSGFGVPGSGEDSPPVSRSHVPTFPRSHGDGDRSHADGPVFETRGHFYKWLEAIALNQLRDAQRALKRQKRDVAREANARPADTSYPDLIQRLASADSTPSRHLRRDEAIVAVMTSLARLPDEQRLVIGRRFLQGVEFERIADELGKSKEAVYVICHRGLKTLRGMMVSITRYISRL